MLTSVKEIDFQPKIVTTTLQICVLTIGQLLHIIGFALAGRYRVLRKNPSDELTMSIKIYIGMGGGGLIAIIGGLMFVYICAKKLYSLQKINNIIL